MASPVPGIIVLALGAGALGAPDALRLLLSIAGQSPVVDIAICIFTMGMVTTQILGAVLLVRFVRKAPTQAGAGGGAPGAPVADHFAQMTLVVSMGVAVLVCACLLVVSGALGSVCLLVDFAARSPTVTVLAIGAMLLASFVRKSRTGAAAVLPCTMPLLRMFREARNADGSACFATTSQLTAYLTGLPLVAACLILVITFVAHGGDDALPLFPGFINMFVAVATVVGTVLVIRFSRRARNAAGAGGGAAPTPATDTRGFSKLTLATSLAVAACLLATTSAPPELEPDGAAYTCRA